MTDERLVDIDEMLEAVIEVIADSGLPQLPFNGDEEWTIATTGFERPDGTVVYPLSFVGERYDRKPLCVNVNFYRVEVDGEMPEYRLSDQLHVILGMSFTAYVYDYRFAGDGGIVVPEGTPDETAFWLSTLSYDERRAWMRKNAPTPRLVLSEGSVN